MATSSFDQKFIIKDKAVAEEFRNDLKKAKPKSAASAEPPMDKEKAAQLLRRTFTN